MKNGRKFVVVIMASVLLVLLAVYAAIGAMNGIDVSWISGVMMTVGSVYPAYMGANAIVKQKKAQASPQILTTTTKEAAPFRGDGRGDGRGTR